MLAPWPGGVPGVLGTTAATIRQRAARTLVSWRPEATRVERALPEDVKPTVLANRDAAVRRSSPELGAPPTALPDWTIRTPPPPPAVLVGYYREAEARSGIPWVYLAAVHFVESRMGRIHGNSPAGAQGPMQFLASTWETFGNEVYITTTEGTRRLPEGWHKP